MHKVDLNCDLGEGFGMYSIGNDEAIMDYVTSVNIACGFHAGDPEIMQKTVELAMKKGVAIGAHPGYQDLVGFGRREIKMTHDAIRASIIYQVGALKSFVEASGGKLQHVKPHGALYSLAASDYGVAMTIAKAIYDIDKNLIFMGLSNSEMIKAAEDIGLKAAREVFADRRYTKDLKLVSRSVEGSLIEDVDDSISQCIDIIVNSNVMDIELERRELSGDSICIHGDNAHGIELASMLEYTLKSQGIKLKPLRDFI